ARAARPPGADAAGRALARVAAPPGTGVARRARRLVRARGEGRAVMPRTGGKRPVPWLGGLARRGVRRLVDRCRAGDRRGLPPRRGRLRRVGGTGWRRRPRAGHEARRAPLPGVAHHEAALEAHDRTGGGLAAALL